ncbi:hypothetical protein EYZ11_012150 [Aspergillus tanneri]|uniref:PWI domain-containing protein n=1 Tax=Aspergillus tanneri TaxID=1220188 RepID=A0A4S3J0Z4_9EURO|nr:hypothetical protein EYZ11_012150 [Aspergillus tanneri]
MANNVDAKLLKQTKFPPEFNRKVDMTKVNIEVMKKWIAGKISEILGNEDDVVIELCFNLLEGSRFPDIKSLQIQLTGFLDKDTARFCKELWSLCLSAQENAQGVPKELLEAKKLELIQEKKEPLKKLVDRKSRSGHESGSWNSSGGESETSALEEVEEVGAAEVATLIDVGLRPGDTVVTVFETFRLDGSSIRTSPQVPAEAVTLRDHQIALSLALALDRLLHLGHLIDNAMQAGTGTGAVDRGATPSPQTGGIAEGREGAVRFTVIELDPIPAVIHRAHVVPEETEGDRDPFLSVHRVRGREDRRIGTRDEGDLRRIPQEPIREKAPLILRRPANPVTITV